MEDFEHWLDINDIFKLSIFFSCDKGYAWGKKFLSFRDTYLNIYRWEDIMSGTCFKIISWWGEKSSWECRWNNIGHLFVIVETMWWVHGGPTSIGPYTVLLVYMFGNVPE